MDRGKAVADPQEEEEEEDAAAAGRHMRYWRRRPDTAEMRKLAAEHIVIKKSRIKKAGLGVFTTRIHIPPNEKKVLGWYKGRVVSPAEWEAMEPEDTRYILETDDGTLIDGSNPTGGGTNWTRYINSSYKSGRRANVAFVNGGVVAVRHISPGDELLVNYGPRWFN